MPRPSVSVLISLTDHTDIVEIAEALGQQSLCGEFEVIIVDPSGVDETRRRREAIPPDIAARINAQKIETPPTGRGRALNEAVLRASGELYVFLGDDFIPAPEWLENHVRLHEQQPQDEVVGLGPAVFPDELRRDPFLRWLDESSLAFGARFGGPEGGSISPTWFYGANTSIKRGLFWRAGLFDDDFPYDALEDYELSFRLFRLGMNVVYLPGAKAIHHHLLTLDERVAQLRRCGESLALLDAKYATQPLASIRLRRKAWRHALRAWGWKLLGWVNSSDAVRQACWFHTIEASFQRGYEESWRRMAAEPPRFRRLSVSLPEGIEETLAAGVLRWDFDQRSTGQTLYAFPNEDSQLRETERDGKPCLEIDHSLESRWAYFRIDPIFARYAARSIRLKCELLAPAATQIWVEYDSDDQRVQIVDGKPGAFKRTQPHKASGRWQTLEFAIPDLLPRERINMGDFRIVGHGDPGAPFYLRSVEVIREGAATPTELSPFAGLQKMGFPPTDQPRVSIVIPVHNHLLYTLQCLQSLAANPGTCASEIIVVDDASSDGTRLALQSIPGLRIVELDQNLGFTGACRRGAEAARGELLLFLNNDTIAQPRWLDELLAVLDEHPRAGAVGSRLIYPQTGTEQHVGIAYDAHGRPFHLDRDGGTALGPIEATWPVPAVTGACLLTPRRLYERLGGFDPVYDQECQDIDYCCKVIEADHSIYYCGSSILLHYESVTRKELRWQPNSDVELFLQRWEVSADGFHVTRRRTTRDAKAA